MSMILLVVAVMVVAQTTEPPHPTKPATPILPATAKPEATTATTIAESATGAVLSAQPGLAPVINTIDGDTITVNYGGKTETVRLIGIDTPETHDPRKPVQCFGESAAAYTKLLLQGQSVRLEADPTNSNRDKYNRLLRYVYLPDGTAINAKIIQQGYAFAYTVFPFTKQDEFVTLENEARSANRGLWAGCKIDSSNQIKQTSGSK